MKRIAVFCGSSFGNKEIYKEQAMLLGKVLANQRIDLIYGGAKVGLMGAVANGALKEGGTVIGVLPRFLQYKELVHEQLKELILVDSMHERKLKIQELSHGAIALPGGVGTLDELFEMFTWAQLGLHNKPIAILNVNGYYDTLICLLEEMVKKGFLNSRNRQMLLYSDNIYELLEMMKNYSVLPDKELINI